MGTDSNLHYHPTLPDEALSSGHDLETLLQATTESIRSEQQQADHEAFMYRVSFVNGIKAQFEDTPDVYRTFLNVLHDRSDGIILEMILRVLGLFWGHDDLLRRFNSFLPDNYLVEYTSDAIETMTSINIATPDGTVTYSIEQVRERDVFHPDPAAIVQSILSVVQSSVATLQRDTSSSVTESSMPYSVPSFVTTLSGTVGTALHGTKHSVDSGTQTYPHVHQI